MAEIGDIRRFSHQKSLVSFAGTDPVKNESGDSKPKSAKASKRGSPYLCKTLFIIMSVLLVVVGNGVENLFGRALRPRLSRN